VNHEIAALFDRFERAAPQQLARSDAERLAQLIQSDPRCCEHLPQSFATAVARRRFRRVLNQAWVDEEYAEVLDYRPRLLRSAGQHRRRHAPLVAVLLYATWIEHTVNAVLITAARASGVHTGPVDTLSKNIVAGDFPTRLSKLWARYGAPPIEHTYKSRILRFMDLRNDLIHYKWIGMAPDRLQTELAYMRTLATGASDLIAYLRKLERQATTLGFRKRIRRLLQLKDRVAREPRGR
jgi:hypothetical protein